MKSLLTLLLLTTTVCLQAQNIDELLSKAGTDRKKADTLLILARKKLLTAKFDSAAILYEKGIPFAKNTGDIELLSNFYLDRANLASMKEDEHASIVWLQKARPYLQHTSSYDLHNRYLLLNAQAYAGIPKTDSAIHYYRECEKLNNEKNPYRNWLVYTSMGAMLTDSEAFSESEEYLKKAYALTKASGSRADFGVVLRKFADLYYSSKQTERFAGILKEHDEFVKAGKRDYMSDPIHSMLYVNWKEVPLEKKVSFMTDVKEKLLKGGDINSGTLANTYISRFYEEAQEYNKALDPIMENDRLLTPAVNINNLYVNTGIAYRLLKKAGRDREAIAIADKLFTLKDSIIRSQHRSTLLDLEVKYNTERKEKEIALLNSQNQLNEKNMALLNSKNELNHLQLIREMDLRMALTRENELMDSVVDREKAYNDLLSRENQLKRSELEKEQALKAAASREAVLKENELVREKKLRQLLLGAAALLLLSGAVILYQYKKQLRKNRIIEQQRKDLEVLNREIHHRVKNNLQVISSLLDLQAQTLDDEKTAEKFLEGSQRVQSMAFIHQNLYQGETIESIDVQRYIRVLTEHLLQSYNVDTNKIQLTTSVDPLNLHSDTVIPLGMIVNELVSNSLKYAFRNKASGRIDVVLKKMEEKLILRVKDDGVGIPAHIDVTAVNSFGYKIVKAFTQKLKASLTIDKQNGTDVQLIISKYRAA